MHYLFQNETAHLIKDSSTIAPRNDFDAHISTLVADFDGLWKLTERVGFNTVVVYFKSLTDVTVWEQANFPSGAPKFEHFIDLDILLEGIRKTGVSRKEVWNK